MTDAMEHWFEPAPPDGRRLLSTIGTRRVAVVSQSGGGKTYALMRLLELLHQRGSPFVVIDPVGNFWGLRLGKDGKSPGIEIRVLGGAHGDVALPPGSGRAIAEFLAKSKVSLILDVSRLDDDERAQFVTDLATRLYALWSEKRRVLTLILDEAQDFIPEALERKADVKMRAILRRWAHTGRNLGLGLVMLTQAPQNVQKRVFNLADLLLVGRLGGEHERAAVERWVRRKGVDAKALLADVPTLPSGTFYASSPEWLELAGKVTVTERSTYDASKTPELGDESPDERALAVVDLEPLRRALAACLPAEAEEEAEEEPPGPGEPAPSNGHGGNGHSTLTVALERELDEARAELGRRQELIDRLNDRNRKLEQASLQAYVRLREVLPPTVDTGSATVSLSLSNTAPASSVLAAAGLTERPLRSATDRVVIADPAPVRTAASEVRAAKKLPAPPSSELGESSEAYRADILATICTYGPVNRERLSLLSGKSRTSTTFASAIRWLLAAGLIAETSGQLQATREGHRQSNQAPLPTGRALYDHWRAKLKPYDQETFDALAKVRSGLTRQQLSERTGHSQTSTTFADSIRTLKGMGLAGEVGKCVLLLDHVRTAMGLA
jgi:hypothetical protein